jgi:hypothetical protein
MVSQEELRKALIAEQTLAAIRERLASRFNEGVESGPLRLDSAGNIYQCLGRTPLDLQLNMAALPAYFACVRKAKKDLGIAAKSSLIRLAVARDYAGYSRQLLAIAGAYISLCKLAIAGILYRLRIVGVVDIRAAHLHILAVIAG